MLNVGDLKYQKTSEAGFEKILGELRKKFNDNVPWGNVQKVISQCWGFYDGLKLNEKQDKRIKDIYEKTLTGQSRDANKKGEFKSSEPLVAACKNIMSEIARVHWATGAHSAGYVPVYAVGAGAERFAARTDNAQLPLKIADAAGYKH